MKKIMTGALAALTLGSGVMATATPAAAQRWEGHRGGWSGERGWGGGWDRDRRGFGGGAVLGAGILGLAVGAALGGQRYYAPAPRYYYAPAPRYYYAPAPAYYEGPAYYYEGPNCGVHYRWDGYWGRYVAVQSCY